MSRFIKESGHSRVEAPKKRNTKGVRTPTVVIRVNTKKTPSTVSPAAVALLCQEGATHVIVQSDREHIYLTPVEAPHHMPILTVLAINPHGPSALIALAATLRGIGVTGGDKARIEVQWDDQRNRLVIPIPNSFRRQAREQQEVPAA